MQENRKEFDNTEHTLVIEGRNAVPQIPLLFDNL